MDLKQIARQLRGRHPSTLFHFTTKDGLIGILNGNFRLSYAREELRGPTAVRQFGVAMVSFCDLRLSELFEHMQLYNSYGIGLSKEWALRNRLNTVYYVSSQAYFLDAYFQALQELFDHLRVANSGEDLTAITKAYEHLVHMVRFMKNYEGPNAKLALEVYRFADEREWRYVPEMSDLRTLVPIESIDSVEKKLTLNRAIASHVLYFEPSDIRYVIVEREDERDEIIETVFHAKESKYGSSEALRLASRILTAEQIKSDV